MEICLGNLQFSWCIIYLDDIIVFVATPKEHRQRLCAVLSQLWEAGLKLQPTKCKFFKTSVVYLGHKISKEGIQTDDCKVETIKNWPTPSTITELWSLLGFMNYYHCFIKGYVKVTWPFYNQISGDNATRKKEKVKWTEECQEALVMLKALCTSAPILAFADFTRPFKLHTDASTTRLGAVLYQDEDRNNWVIGYAIWALSKSESHHPANKLDFIALKCSYPQLPGVPVWQHLCCVLQQ